VAGAIGLGCLAVMGATSFWRVRRRDYKSFSRAHLLYMVVVVMGSVHVYLAAYILVRPTATAPCIAHADESGVVPPGFVFPVSC
jgi:DMSO/TMAO reductase YedYZ heme-binding membrane subunit